MSGPQRAIGLAGFEAKFAAHPDPWATFSARDEAIKRAAIARALGPGRKARVLELASGNGSNSRMLARRALYLHACEGTASGAALTRRALADAPHARVDRLRLPGRLPAARYDAVVIAELLYYLHPRALRELARDVHRVLAHRGRLVLAHHHIDFPDTAQPPARIHARFLAAIGAARWRHRHGRRNDRWRVDSWIATA